MSHSAVTVFFIFLFSGLGGCLRWSLDKLLLSSSLIWPTSTFLVNILGSFFMGCLWVFSKNFSHFNDQWQIILKVGLLGGLTTFSAFSWQTFELYQKGEILLASSYFFLSPLLALSSVFLGVHFAQWVIQH